MKPSKGSYRSFNGWLWEKFQLHELVEIVRQSSDPDFAQLLNRVREGQQTDNDVIQIKALANTDTTLILISSKMKVKPWFFVTFNIIINHIFPEKFIEIPQVVQKI